MKPPAPKGSRRNPERPRVLQPAEVAGHRLGLELGELPGDVVHDRVVVGALALVELLQLTLGVRGVLARQARQLRRALAVGAVAAGAGRHAGERVAARVDEAAHERELGVLDGVLVRGARLVEAAQHLEVRGGQPLDHGLHLRALALAAGVVGELARDVLRVLAGQPREEGAGAFAVDAVAHEALALDDLLRALEVGGGGGRRGGQCHEAGDGGGGQGGGQEAGVLLHGQDGVRGGRGPPGPAWLRRAGWQAAGAGRPGGR